MAATSQQQIAGDEVNNGVSPSQGGRGSFLFRAVNDRIRELEGHRAVGDYDFVCECEDDTCTSVVRMTADQYEALRAAPNQFVVLPGHERPETEAVLARDNGYVVVAKRRPIESDDGSAFGPFSTRSPERRD